MSREELKDGGHQIYEMIRKTFHSQSGYFLSKSEAYDVMLKVKELFNKREQ